MYIFVDEEANLDLVSFGIGVPMLNHRVQQICKYLKKNNYTFYQRDKSSDWPRVTKEDLLAVHNKEFVEKIFGPVKDKRDVVAETFELINEKGEFHRYAPTTKSKTLEFLIPKVLRHVEGAMKSVEVALEKGESFFLGGGFHHAMSFGGRGFCLLNDIVIAAKWISSQKNLSNIWVIDVDAHKGDGTAELTVNDENITTFSIHMADGWPLDEDSKDSNGNLKPWFLPSDVDIPIKENEEKIYLKKLEEGLLKLEKDFGPADLAIVVQGSDPCEIDQLPSASLLNLSLEEMKKRDLLVYNFLKNRNIPQAYLMSGGYGNQAYKVYCQFLGEVMKKGVS